MTFLAFWFWRRDRFVSIALVKVFHDSQYWKRAQDLLLGKPGQKNSPEDVFLGLPIQTRFDGNPLHDVKVVLRRHFRHCFADNLQPDVLHDQYLFLCGI